MTRQATSSGFPLVRGVQLTKELAVLNWEIQAAQNQLDKSWFDAFLTNAGINAGISSGYSYRGASNYDVILDTTVPSTRKLLLHGNGANGGTVFTDSSAGAKVATAYGNVQTVTGIKKYGSASIQFDGTGDALGYADSADWEVSTSDFQLDGWFRLNAIGIEQDLFFMRASGNHQFIVEVTAANVLKWRVEVAGAAWGTGTALTGTTALTTGVMYYFKLKKVSTTCTLYLSTDGTNLTQEATATGYTGAGPTGAFAVAVGCGVNAGISVDPTVDPFNGWIDDLRFIVGETTSDTVPQAEVDTYTQALVKTITVTMPSAITSIIAFVDTGAATPDLVRFSTDGGSTWTTIPTASIGKIVGVPSGTSCILEVTFTGATELEAWGFAGA